MRRIGFAACAAAAVLAGDAGAALVKAPRFSFSTASAIPGDDVVVRVTAVPKRSAVIRLYLVRRDAAATIRSRSDARLNFIGFVNGRKDARLLFTVPPLPHGSYVLAYSRGRAVRVQRPASLEIGAPAEAGCPATTPNANIPPAAPPWTTFHGDANLWVLLPADGMLRFSGSSGDTLFDKMIWVGRGSVTGLSVEYRRLDVPSRSHPAVTILGTLSGYSGPSWASRMYFQPGCWFVSGRTTNGSLSFIVLVVRE